MTDQYPDSSGSPGALLRKAREQRGLPAAALAAAIKVAPARLEALEADDYSGMHDITFARALAQAVCRALKIDPQPVLALMPEAGHSRLERVDEGLKEPFRERPGRLADTVEVAPWRHPVAWLAALLLVAAAVFVWWPRHEVAGPEGAEPPPGAEPIASAPADAGSVPSGVAILAGAASAVSAVAGTVAAGADGAAARAPGAPAASGAPSSTGPADATAAAPVMPAPASRAAAAASVPALPILAVNPPPPATPGASATPGAAAAAASVAAGAGEEAVQLRAVEDSWVQVTDATGKVLVSRTLVAGEALGLAGRAPLRVRVGNVKGTELAFRGRALDIRAMTRDNTVTLTLPPPAQP